MQNIRVEIEDLTPVKKKLDISVPAETVRKEIDAAYRNIRTNASIPGFRKGAIPMNIIKARFGGNVQEDVTKRLIETTYPQALGEKKLIPVEAPQVELKNEKAEEDKDFAYSITVEVQPSVDIENYKGMALKKEEITWGLSGIIIGTVLYFGMMLYTGARPGRAVEAVGGMK